jgi:hypothetical protein
MDYTKVSTSIKTCPHIGTRSILDRECQYGDVRVPFQYGAKIGPISSTGLVPTWGPTYTLCVILLKIRCYSPNVYAFRFCSALNPYFAICMNWRDSPRFSVILAFTFAEYTIFNHKYVDARLIIRIYTATFSLTEFLSICFCLYSLFLTSQLGMGHGHT